jgi:DDE superfamily endonuclease
MKLYRRIEQILLELRPVFSREATFEWFVLLVWGVLLNQQAPAVTSYLNALGLGEKYYHQALHWFQSEGFGVDQLCRTWGEWLSQHPAVERLQGQRLYVGDGIKVGKEGRKMPGVKGLHQESSNVSKPEWIRGQYFSALGLLFGKGTALFAVPISFKLHDGIEGVDAVSKALTLVDKMTALCLTHMQSGSYVVLDAYYASAKVLQPFREGGLHLISRARISTVAYAAFSPCSGKPGRGRPRKWGSPVPLQSLFASPNTCQKATVWLYGQQTTVYYQCFELFWDSPDATVLFVLTQLPNGKRIILLSSDVTLTALQVVEAYGKRFKIEVCFRTFVQMLGGFAYQFWLKCLDKTPQFPPNLCLADYAAAQQDQIQQKVEAFERFVNLNAISLGILQILALELPKPVWLDFPRWFRTLPQHGHPTEQIVRITLQHLQLMIFPRSGPSLLLDQLLADKIN